MIKISAIIILKFILKNTIFPSFKIIKYKLYKNLK